jgi:hypothetical protein
VHNGMVPSCRHCESGERSEVTISVPRYIGKP